MALRLYFPIDGVIRLLQHTEASPEKEQSFSELEDGKPCPGALVWVSDFNSVYLMSGGLPSLLSDPNDKSSNVIVEALGWGEYDDHPRAADTELGGDDFAEHLHLLGKPMQSLIRKQAEGYGWFVIDVIDADRFVPRVARNPPDSPPSTR